ncbi:SIMPL domain-containing protein [Chenggangzhangella methanolivorans]|uniref:SIMPL domain-containing protein n=1 Tax=Chenggangzhangella methanolivorans TaxID=1437009 RepID=A0A9E6R9L1_9HYPH|nr:SIMPL domain-containing protein [Chenggangzhangella methanolivorans]QZN99348.1 SIMPL domain-containing protein [Chenggangzhangella methanolivorans]
MKLFAAALLAAAALASPALAEPQPKPRSVTATGEGSISAAPDLAIVSSGVVTSAPGAADALKANAEAMTKVFAAAKKAGIEDRDVATSGLSVQPQYDYGDGQRPRAPKLTGYEARNMVTIRVRQIDKAGGLVDALVAAGSNQIEGFSFEISDRDEKLDAARGEAVKDARRKAELYAAAAGAKLGQALSIEEAGDVGEPARPFAMRAKAMDAAPTPIAKGEQELTARVTVRWKLED